MTDLIEHFTTEELRAELVKREKVRNLQRRVIHLQETLDELVADAAELKEIITVINKRAETLVIEQGGRDYNESV